MSSQLSDYDYLLPEELIAQVPAAVRDESRLLALIGETTSHQRFHDLIEILRPGDLLIMNDTQVLPARLFGKRPGGGRVEVLLCEELGDRRWVAMARPGNKLKPGATMAFGSVGATVAGYWPAGQRVLEFDADPFALMAASGELPLPPYIKSRAADPGRYQTVYAASPGAVAAPTAGLHFTPELLERLAQKGVATAALTLHVGPGTFRPVQVENLDTHQMHAERYWISPEVATAWQHARETGGRVIAVGTTVTRALEAALAGDRLEPSEGRTAIFIRPGYRFKAIDGLITNFHLPKSTLLMLVSAFAEQANLGGLVRLKQAYSLAVAERYRFFSFGDAMVLLPSG